MVESVAASTADAGRDGVTTMACTAATRRARRGGRMILPPRLARRVAAVQAMVVTPSRPASAVDAATLSTIAGACRDCEILRFRYLDHAGTASARAVEPHRLVNTGRRW